MVLYRCYTAVGGDGVMGWYYTDVGGDGVMGWYYTDVIQLLVVMG